MVYPFNVDILSKKKDSRTVYQHVAVLLSFCIWVNRKNFYKMANKKPINLQRFYLHFRDVAIIISKVSCYGLLAQLVEHLTLNQGVQGSSP